MGERSAARTLFARTDDGPGHAAAVMQLGYLAADAGRLREARDLQERSLAMWGDFVPYTGWRQAILLELAALDAALGESERVPGRLREASAIFAHIGDQVGLASCEQMLRAARTGINT